MNTWFEVVGYIASGLIVLSITRTSLIKLRLFGLAGSITFTTYGFLIGAVPIALVNIIITGIHVYFLWSLRSPNKEFFQLLAVSHDSKYLAYFLDFHRDEIERYQPEFDPTPAEDWVASFVLRDTIPAGLFIGRKCEDESVEVLLDFAIPQYRDFQIGRFLFSDSSGLFADSRCDKAWSNPGAREHVAYLEKMGFVRSGDVYVKNLVAVR
ncbi:MAG: hypothetical protein HKN07_07015 [Acidimicrobiia bacterium]|nr:hypothetical protein [Acidimicrobiia bacterium]NNF63995.1 hypothetical protein [Acidimicrobiia bacterium]